MRIKSCTLKINEQFKQISVHLDESFMRPGCFSLHVTDLSGGQSVPAQVDEVRLCCKFLPVTPGALTGSGPWAAKALTRVKRGGDILAQHDHPVLQVTDRARRAAGRTVQTPLSGVKPLLQVEHCSS